MTTLFHEPFVAKDFSTISAGKSTLSSSSMMSYAGPIMAVVGAVQSGIGAYYSAQSAKDNLQFQSEMSSINARMSEINARQAERTAQSILYAGEKAQGQVSLRAGKVKGAQRASQGARGIVAGEGNAAEEIATTDLMKETDMLTINANATRSAWAARMAGVNAQTQSINASNEALLRGVSAAGISPFMSAGTSLLNSGAAVATSWYSMQRANRLADALGVA